MERDCSDAVRVTTVTAELYKHSYDQERTSDSPIRSCSILCLTCGAETRGPLTHVFLKSEPGTDPI